MEAIAIMVVGTVIGGTVFPAHLDKVTEKLMLVFTALLIFSMGVLLGGRDSFLEELAEVGVASVLFCVLPIVFSTGIVYFFTKQKSIVSVGQGSQDSPASCGSLALDKAFDGSKEAAESENRGERAMIALAVGALLLGAAYGLSGISFVLFDAFATYSNIVLYVLMFLVGINVGRSRDLLSRLKNLDFQMLSIPLGIVIGSVLGGLVCSLILGLPLATGGAIGSGMGWYSLSGVMIAEIAGAQAGSIAFLSNLLREIMSFFLIPWISRHLNYSSCIAPAGATSEDTTLPMLIRCTNPETVLLAVFNGVVCSACVPLLIELFHRFM